MKIHFLGQGPEALDKIGDLLDIIDALDEPNLIPVKIVPATLLACKQGCGCYPCKILGQPKFCRNKQQSKAA